MNTIHRAGLTLIELLVTMTIVAVIMAVLVPTVAGIRTSARSTMCLGQIRQFGVASLAYAQDQQSMLPANYAPGAGMNRWSDRLVPYLADEQYVTYTEGSQQRQRRIFRCPDRNALPLRYDQLEDWMVANYTWFRQACSTYVMVESLDAVNFNAWSGPSYFSSTWTTDWRKFKSYRVAGVTHPSNRMLYCDQTGGEELAMYSSAKSQIETLAAQSRRAGPPALADYQGWIKGAGRTISGFAGYKIETRHRNKAAAAFCDGRAAMVYAAQGVVAAYAPDRLAEFYP